MNTDYKLDSIFILETSNEDNTSKERGTCFAISDSLVISAKHVVEDKSQFICFLTSDHYISKKGINLEIIHKDDSLDFVILKSEEMSFNSFIPIGMVPIDSKYKLKTCGYPVEKKQIHAPIDITITNDLTKIDSSNYCFEVSQCPTVTNYKGMSGSPVMYNGYFIGLLVVQQGSSTLSAISSFQVFNKANLLFSDLKIVSCSLEEIEYFPPEHPPSPFVSAIDCTKNNLNVKGLDIGFDFNVWRLNELVTCISDWLIDYSLSASQKEDMHLRLTSQMKLAFKQYPINDINAMSDLFLHIVIRQNYKTIPIVNKVFDVDGNSIFSSSHVVLDKGKIEIWLGLSSIKNNISDAVTSTLDNINAIITADNIKTRLVLITEEMNTSWPFADKLKKISDPNIPMEDKFDKIIVPIFIAYDSEIIKSYEKTEFKKKFQLEVDSCRELIQSRFSNKLIKIIDLRVFIFPVDDINIMHNKFIKELEL